VPAGASGIYSACVYYTAHQDVKLLLEERKLTKLMANQNTQLSASQWQCAIVLNSDFF
jgi:hypothetical protein